MHSLKLIAGLGNPGKKHERDRHNVGFWFASRLAAAQRIELKTVAKYHGLLGKLALASGDLWLLLPQTYMNVSGKSRSEEHTSELQSHHDLVCRLLLEKKKKK